MLPSQRLYGLLLLGGILSFTIALLLARNLSLLTLGIFDGILLILAICDAQQVKTS